MEVCSGSAAVLSELTENTRSRLLEGREVQARPRTLKMKGKLEKRLSLGREKSGEVCSQEGRIRGPCSAVC